MLIGLLNAEGGSLASPATGDSAVAAADYANAHLGGLAGHAIKIDRCGDKGDGPSATACANKFVSDGVVAVVVSGELSADEFGKIILGAGIPFFGGNGAASATELASPTTYFADSGSATAFAGQALYAKAHGWTNVAMVALDFPLATQTINSLAKPIYSKEGVNVSIVPIPFGVADVSAQIQAALAKKPDALAVFTPEASCLAVLKARQSAGSTVPVLGFPGCSGTSVIQGMGSGMTGVVAFNLGDTSSSQPEAVLYRTVMTTYEPNSDTGGLTTAGYLGMLSLIRIVNADKVTDPTRETIKAALASNTSVSRPIGSGVTMSCGTSVFTVASIKSTICDGHSYQGVFDGSNLTQQTVTDTSSLVNSAFG